MNRGDAGIYCDERMPETKKIRYRMIDDCEE